MQLLDPQFVRRFAGRIVNVHPALLPAFPGLDAVGQALAHGVRVTGVTVHFVDEGVDSGPIILQRAVPVPDDRDRDALEATIHATEHALLPEAIRMIASGRVEIDPRGGRLVAIKPGAERPGSRIDSAAMSIEATIAQEGGAPLRREARSASAGR